MGYKMVQVFRLPRVSKYDVIRVLTEDEARAKEREGYKRRPRRRRGKFVLRKEKMEWVIFEEEMKSFLNALGFSNVGADDLGGYRIDAYGGFRDTFLVIDCTIAEEPGFRNLRNKILGMNGKKSDLKRAIRSNFGKKYKDVKFLIATRRIDLSEKNEELAHRKRIKLWSERHFEMYKSLFKQVGPHVRYWILKELGARQQKIHDGRKRNFEVKAFEVSGDGGDIYYFFLMDAGTLTELGYVSRLLPGARNAYQRALYQKKITSIAKFIEDDRTFQNNVIVSLERIRGFVKARKLTSDIRIGELKIPKIYASAWVIDGQHRIYGFKKASAENLVRKIPVAAFVNLKPRKQADMYVTINRTQKPVEANDLWRLFPQTNPRSYEAWAPSIVQNLNKKGVFRDKIYIPGISYKKKKSYKIDLFSFCEGVENTKLWNYLIGPERSILSSENFEHTVKRACKVLNNYFKLIYKVGAKVNENWNKEFFFTNNGLNVMLVIFGDIVSYPDIQKIPNPKEVENMLKEPLQDYCKANVTRINELFDETFSYSGRNRIAAVIGEVVARHHPGFGGGKVEKLRETPEFVILGELEEGLRRCIVRNLLRLSRNWWKERVPNDVRKNAEKRKEREEKPWPAIDVNLISWINSSEYSKIILRGDNWEEVFKNIFKDEGFISTRLKELEDIRNAIMHFRRPLSEDEKIKLHLFSKEILEKIREST